MPYTLTQAAIAAGRNRSSILRAIKTGKLSATRDEATNGWLIDPAELHRVYDGASVRAVLGAAPADATPRNSGTDAENHELRARLADKDATIDDLRRRLDEERSERRQAVERLLAAQERIAALLTDQRPAPAPPAPPSLAQPEPRRWWNWRRQG